MFRVSVLFLSLLFLLTSVNAKDDHQVGVKFGLTSIDNEDGWNLENGTFFADFLFDTPTVIDPRFDLGYISLDEDDNDGVGSLWQFAINGVYDIDIENNKYIKILSPYVLAGLGYEYVSDSRSGFKSHPYMQVGAGINYDLTDNIDLVTEFKAIQIFDNDNSDEDNEFSLLFGLRIPLFVNVIRQTEASQSQTFPVSTPIKQIRTYEPAPQIITPAVVSYENVQETIVVDNTLPQMTANSVVIPAEVQYVEEESVTSVATKPIRSATSSKRKILDISFESNSATIKSGSKKSVKNYAQFLKNNPSVKVTIEGYTDNSGTRAKNIMLSKKRAEAVVSLLTRMGVSSSRLMAIGKGDLNPIADNETPKGRAQNRRIEAVTRD